MNYDLSRDMLKMQTPANALAAADLVATAAPAGSAVPAGSAAPSGTGEDPSAFVPVGNEKPTQSGEALLVEAYAAIWLIAMVFVVIAWRRTRALESKIQVLELALDRANLAATPSTKRSPKSDPGTAPASEG